MKANGDDYRAVRGMNRLRSLVNAVECQADPDTRQTIQMPLRKSALDARYRSVLVDRDVGEPIISPSRTFANGSLHETSSQTSRPRKELPPSKRESPMRIQLPATTRRFQANRGCVGEVNART